FAGKLLPFKRPLDVVRAVALVRAKGLDCRVMVAGSGPLEAELIQEAAAQEVPLDFLGFQNQSQMPAAYASADLLVLPSTGRETWGLVANEALACGVPILVSDQVGCGPDLAKGGGVGRIFPMGDIRALADAIAAGLTFPPSSEAVARVSDLHSIEAACEGIVEALSYALSRISPPSIKALKSDNS
ncbi:MAG: glycosyltransferase family 4 protein, partial [Ignavibacteria bacterium]|nr:glycosyltransferase family 4 protein [Ignavibacteria bacterium]